MFECFFIHVKMYDQNKYRKLSGSIRFIFLSLELCVILEILQMVKEVKILHQQYEMYCKVALHVQK